MTPVFSGSGGTRSADSVGGVPGAPSIGPSRPAERPLARQSAQWRVYVPFYARALALQGSHPTVAASLVDHSSVFEDPLGRMVRTTAYAIRMWYDDDPARTASEIRSLHRHIAGTDFDGRPYHAWDRDVWAWVHLTTAESLLYALEVSCGPLRPAQREAVYAASRRAGALYGVRDRDMPPDVAGLRNYVDDGIRRRLHTNPGTDRLRRAVLAGDFFGRLPLPSPARRALGRAVAPPIGVVVFGAFPDAVRRLWGVRWTVRHQAEYAGFLLATRALAATLPDRLRMVPAAYRALHS